MPSYFTLIFNGRIKAGLLRKELEFRVGERQGGFWGRRQLCNGSLMKAVLSFQRAALQMPTWNCVHALHLVRTPSPTATPPAELAVSAILDFCLGTINVLMLLPAIASIATNIIRYDSGDAQISKGELMPEHLGSRAPAFSLCEKSLESSRV